MKKGKLFLPLFLAAVMCLNPVSFAVMAEGEEYREENDENSGERDDSEEESEHQEAYYAEIQSNLINGWPQGEAIDGDAAIVIDADTGAILYSKNIEGKEYPASITKIMTVLLALENGNLEDVVKFSENAVYSIEFGSSHLGLTEGEELTLEQCLYGIMLASANEISNAVAEHIGGDIDTFVQMMNDRATQLGCTGTHFVNVHGLHDENHYVTARDMALIMQAAMKNEKFREIISTVEYYYPKTNLVDEERYFMNHHKMLFEDGVVYDGCIGGKTGYTDEAWNTLVTAAKRDDLEIICVVLREPGLYKSYDDTKILLDYAFDNFQRVELDNSALTKDNLEIVGIEDADELTKIQNADFTQPPFALEKSTVLTLPKNIDSASLQKKMDFTTGTLTYCYEGQALGASHFVYTGLWETETEAVTEAVTETEIQTEAKADGILGTVQSAFKNVADGAASAYEKMDLFIKENTVAAAIIGAVLLVIFIPLLLVAINRNRKYKKIMHLREQEMVLRRELEAEIEKKSAAQVEAELRAEELRVQLEEEQKKNRRQEEIAGGQEERGDTAEAAEVEETAQQPEMEQDMESVQGTDEPEDEFIEVSLEEAEKDGGTF